MVYGYGLRLNSEKNKHNYHVYFCQYFGIWIMVKNKKNGVIINIGSEFSVVAPDHRIYKKNCFKPVTYSVIKHGIIGLTKYLSTYWAKNGVRC